MSAWKTVSTMGGGLIRYVKDVQDQKRKAHSIGSGTICEPRRSTRPKEAGHSQEIWKVELTENKHAGRPGRYILRALRDMEMSEV